MMIRKKQKNHKQINTRKISVPQLSVLMQSMSTAEMNNKIIKAINNINGLLRTS